MSNKENTWEAGIKTMETLKNGIKPSLSIKYLALFRNSLLRIRLDLKHSAPPFHEPHD